MPTFPGRGHDIKLKPWSERVTTDTNYKLFMTEQQQKRTKKDDKKKQKKTKADRKKDDN